MSLGVKKKFQVERCENCMAPKFEGAMHRPALGGARSLRHSQRTAAVVSTNITALLVDSNRM
jgi:hypothetical protein